LLADDFAADKTGNQTKDDPADPPSNPMANNSCSPRNPPPSAISTQAMIVRCIPDGVNIADDRPMDKI
jgi:hypothetical protein